MSSSLPRLRGQMLQHLEYFPNAQDWKRETVQIMNHYKQTKVKTKTNLNSAESSPHIDLSRLMIVIGILID